VAGEGSRIPAEKLREAMRQSRSLEKAFLKFAHSFMNQTANTAFSNGTATLEERLARWLLMAKDRLDGDEIPLTHEFLSLMLGVRRAGVTVALNYLESRGIIRLSRGQDRHNRPEGTQGKRQWHLSRAGGQLIISVRARTMFDVDALFRARNQFGSGQPTGMCQQRLRT